MKKLFDYILIGIFFIVILSVVIIEETINCIRTFILERKQKMKNKKIMNPTVIGSFVFILLLTFILIAIGYTAITTSYLGQETIWNRVFDSTNNKIRIVGQ